MHSSRMRTARSLTDRISWYQAEGVHGTHTPRARTPPSHPMPPWPCTPPPRHACPQPRTPPRHAHTPSHTCPSSHTCPPVNRMTNRCKNITLPQTSLQAVTRQHSSRMHTTRLETVRASVSVATTRCHSQGSRSPNEQV